ncbi:HK97 family phage prohead protease [Paraburkholderia youngii]|uniref:HK97 family phage prohead protease n=1 Tax=Paraburkholderia youngii TaxID=2782701 RepID=UPI003D23908B
MKVETYPPRQCHAGEFVRAKSLVTINRAVDEDRIIEGIASTPTVDRYGDVVEPGGAVFRTPLPLLVNHNPAETVGQVLLGAASVAGITFRAQLAKIAEPGPLKDRVDGAWQAIRAGLVAHVSIGFRALKTEQMHDGGIRYLSWEWLELSLTPLPANPNARIENVRGHPAAELIERELQLDRARRPRRDYSETRVVRLSDG